MQLSTGKEASNPFSRRGAESQRRISIRLGFSMAVNPVVVQYVDAVG